MKLKNITMPRFLGVTLGLTLSAFAFANDTSSLIGLPLDQNRDLVDTIMHGRNYMIQVDEAGKIKQVIDTGANGDGRDPLELAANATRNLDDQTGQTVELPVNYQGQDAIDRLGTDLEKAAANHGLTSEKLKDMLLNDDTMRIDSDNRLFFVDHTADNPDEQHPDVAGITNQGATTSNMDSSVPMAATADLTNAFKLHSKPGSSKTIYLNFVGFTGSNTAWSSGTIVAPAYDLNGNPAIFDDNERSNIISIWNRVAEDYIPFDVDVTTEPPTADALLRTSAADSTFGTQVVVTKTGTISCKCGGIAYVGVVSMVNNTRYQPAWVFQQSLANNEKYIAEAVSHEAGHTLGLLHDGQGTSVGYYAGHGSGETGWAPIMGVGYYKNLTQWSAGAYPNANNRQDDIATLASNGLISRNDDAGDSLATARSLSTTVSNTVATISNFGVIEKAGDLDMYSFTTTGGALSLMVSPAKTGPNLDTALTLYNAAGAVLASSAPETGLKSSITTSVPAGTYYLAVTGTARQQVGSDYGYPLYASLGQYQITGTYAVGNTHPIAPTAVITPSTLTGPAALTVSFSANQSLGNGNIVAYQWTFGDGTSSSSSNPVHVYERAGTYIAQLTVKNQYNLTHSTSVQIVATAPTLKMLRIGATGMGLSVFSKSKATVALKVVNAQGKPVPNAKISGTWSGAFKGKASKTTDANGIAILISNPSSVLRGGSGTYTVDDISAAEHIYNPAKNIRSVMTISW